MVTFLVDAFIAQFALLDIFTSEKKHFGRLKWLLTGGEENSPVELPACKRSLVLSNLFCSVYYASMRARVVCGKPWGGDDRPPLYKGYPIYRKFHIVMFAFQTFFLAPFLLVVTAF